jgi:hypothetical protein
MAWHAQVSCRLVWQSRFSNLTLSYRWQAEARQKYRAAYRPKNPPVSGPMEPSWNRRRGSAGTGIPNLSCHRRQSCFVNTPAGAFSRIFSEFLQRNVSPDQLHIRRGTVNHQVRQEIWEISQGLFWTVVPNHFSRHTNQIGIRRQEGHRSNLPRSRRIGTEPD